MNTRIVSGLRPAEKMCLESMTAAPHGAGVDGLSSMFATAFMVGFVEWACVEAIKPHMKAGERTMGTHVHLRHAAPVSSTLDLTANVDLIEVKGDRLRFRVECFDAGGCVASAFHERVLTGAGSCPAKRPALRRRELTGRLHGSLIA